MTNRSRSPISVALLLSAVLAFAAPTFADRIDPLEAAPSAPSASAQVEALSGRVKEVVIDDRVAGVVVRYRSLLLSDGTAVALRGANAENLPNDASVEVAGRRNGRHLFVEGARVIGTEKSARAAARRNASVDGELRMFYIDYDDEDKAEAHFDIHGADGKVTPLRLPILPEALQRGMQVTASGSEEADGAIDPDVITITALPTEPETKADTKAAKTNKVLVILMTFSDSAAPTFTQSEAQAVWTGTGGVAEYYKEVSYGQQLLSVTVTPWIATGSATPSGCNWSQMGLLGRNAATARGYVLSNYQNLVYVFPRVSACGWLGLGYVGTSGAWINGRNTLLVYGHELGHNFGMSHAGSVDCGTASVGGTCSASEYGEPFGIMGNKTTMHVSAPQKLDLAWISSTQVKTHSSGTATYTINPLETAGGSVYAVKIPAATNRTYWLEYRRPIGFDSGLASYPNTGAQVRLTAPFETLCSGCSTGSMDTEFVDMTPATSALTDGTLVAGQSYVDTKYGITVNVISATTSGLTVQVAGPGSTSTATTTTLASSANPSLLGTIVTFTASVSGSSPTGTVAFTAGGSTLLGCGAVSLSGSGNVRTAACVTSTLLTGTHSIVAAYSGNASNFPSTSATLSQAINTAPTGTTNVALASAGAIATASSTYGPGYPASAVNNGDRKGANWGSGGGWIDSTSNVWPDWVQIDFNGSKTIDRVVVYSIQDNYSSPVEPSDTMTFSQHGAVTFTVQAWNGSSWVTLGTVTGNSLVKRTITFASYTTSRIRINITSALHSYSRLAEVEVFGVAGPAAQTTTTSVTSSANPSTSGSNVAFTASVSGSSPTGTVAFTANGATLSGCGSVALSGSGNVRTAVCTASGLAIGSHSIRAAYSGNTANGASTSPTITQTVNAVSANVALASVGATASASSSYGAGYAASAIINNDRKGTNWNNGGGWMDNTSNVWPDWAQIDFSGSKTINRVVVYSIQDDFRNPIEPTTSTTFTRYGVVSFSVQGWNGSSWVTLGTVTGNNRVKREVTFTPFVTSRIRINVTDSPDASARLAEVEAWGY